MNIVEINPYKDRTIYLGKKGENKVTQIIFDCSEFAEEYGIGTAQLFHWRPCDTVATPVAIEFEDNYIKWLITSGDTAAAGYGEAEIHWLVDDQLAKSVILETQIEKSLKVGGENPPEPIKYWYDKLIEDIEDVRDNGVINPVRVREVIQEYLEENPVPAGKDGISPTITFEEKSNGEGYNLTITDISGERTIDILHGVKGDPGEVTYVENPYNDTAIINHLMDIETRKQDKLIAGENIVLSTDGRTISAMGTTPWELAADITLEKATATITAKFDKEYDDILFILDVPKVSSTTLWNIYFIDKHGQKSMAAQMNASVLSTNSTRYIITEIVKVGDMYYSKGCFGANNSIMTNNIGSVLPNALDRVSSVSITFNPGFPQDTNFRFYGRKQIVKGVD